MRRYLIVAHRTLGDQHLLEEAQRRKEADGGRCAFHLLVPMEHGAGAWSDGRTHAAADAVLQHGIERFAEHGIEVTGEVGDMNPVLAVKHLMLTGQHFDEILLSTLPAGPSKWLKVDVPRRMAKAVNIAVTHVVAERVNA